MEYLEHRADSTTERLLRGSGRVGPLVGGALGAIPQCGFSAAASGLYAGRIITTGTIMTGTAVGSRWAPPWSEVSSVAFAPGSGAAGSPSDANPAGVKNK